MHGRDGIIQYFCPVVVDSREVIRGIGYRKYLSDGGPIQCDRIALLGWTDIITKLKGCDTDITEAIRTV